MKKALLKIAAAAITLTAVAMPALAQRWDDRGSGYDRGYDDQGYRDYRDRDDRYDRGDRYDRRDDRWGRQGLHGPGMRYLDRRMFRTDFGRRIAWRYARRDGWLSVEGAEHANQVWLRAVYIQNHPRGRGW